MLAQFLVCLFIIADLEVKHTLQILIPHIKASHIPEIKFNHVIGRAPKMQAKNLRSNLSFINIKQTSL